MLAPSADANTAAGAPPWIWVTNPDDGPKFNVTVVPGFAFWKSVPILVNASVSDAAADTVIVPESFVVLPLAAPAVAGTKAVPIEPATATNTVMVATRRSTRFT